MRTMKEEKEDSERRIRADALSSRALAALSVSPLTIPRPRERFQNSST